MRFRTAVGAAILCVGLFVPASEVSAAEIFFRHIGTNGGPGTMSTTTATVSAGDELTFEFVLDCSTCSGLSLYTWDILWDVGSVTSFENFISVPTMPPGFTPLGPPLIDIQSSPSEAGFSGSYSGTSLIGAGAGVYTIGMFSVIAAAPGSPTIDAVPGFGSAPGTSVLGGMGEPVETTVSPFEVVFDSLVPGTMQWTGTVSDVDSQPFSVGVSDGDEAIVTLQFDATTPDSEPSDPEFGRYSSIGGISVRIGSQTFEAGDEIGVAIRDDPSGDRFSASGFGPSLGFGSPFSLMSIGVSGAASAFIDDSLPMTTDDLQGLPPLSLTLFDDDITSGPQFVFSIDELVPVPEPGVLGGLSAGWLFLCGLRRRQKTKYS